MKIRIDPLLFSCVLAGLAACSNGEVPDSSAEEAVPEVTYVTTESFDEQVLDSDIPVLVDFTAEWCVPCREVDPIIMSLYPEMHGRAKIFKLDIDKDTEVYRNLGINGVPNVLFFNDGVEQDRIGSPQPREIYVQYLEAMIDGRSTFEVSLQFLKEDAFRRNFIVSRSIEELGKTLESYPELMTDPLENGQSPLSMILNGASYLQDRQIEFALDNGATPSTRDLVGLGRCEEFLSALERDPDAVNRPDPDGATPLYLAVSHAERLEGKDCIKTVLDAGGDPSRDNSQDFHLGTSVLFMQNMDLLGEMIDRGLDLERHNAEGHNMLHTASLYGYRTMLQYLIDRGADVGALTLYGKTSADLVRESIVRLQEFRANGVDNKGVSIEPEVVERLNESIAANTEILNLLEG